MANLAQIKIWNKMVGAIYFNENTSVASFEFEESFLRNEWNLSPIKMPINNSKGKIFSFAELSASNTFRGLPGLLADALPDNYGNALINNWLTKSGKSKLNPVETLCFIGKRAMGALEFEPINPPSVNLANKLAIDELVIAAQNILQNRNEFAKNIGDKEEQTMMDVLKIGTSAGGARAKAIIAYNPITNEVRSGQTNAPKGFSHWILKFDGVHDSQFGVSDGYGRVEMAYYKMAIDCGIEMMPCKLFEENGRAHFMTMRFDRPTDQEKLHVQTFCAIQHYDFKNVDFYSYEQLFETMRTLGLPYPDAEQLFTRMVFNVMARNCDDHTKNFAFTMDKTGTWKLSPAYDVCHSYRPNSDWVSQHNLSLNGKRKDFTKTDFLELAKNMNIKKPKQIIEKVSSVVSNWNNYAEEQKVEIVLRDSITKTLLVL